MQELWHSTLAHMKTVLPPEVFETWLGKLEVISPPEGESGDTLWLQTPSLPHLNYIQENFSAQIENKLSELAGRPISVKNLPKNFQK